MTGYLLQTVPLWYFYLYGIVSIALVWFLASKLADTSTLVGKYKEALLIARERRDTWRQKAIGEKEVSGQILRAVVPLVEKTDWMTGRWGGQFSTLVRMENRRNADVEKVQQAIMRLPSVKDMTVAEKTAILLGTADAAVRGLSEVALPEDQRLEFSSVRGVERVSDVSDEDYYGDDFYLSGEEPHPYPIPDN